MASILCSIYPPVNRTSITTDYNAAPLESLSDVLKRRGLRTGFFNAGDLNKACCAAWNIRLQF